MERLARRKGGSRRDSTFLFRMWSKGSPIVFFPPVGDTGIIVRGNADVREINAATISHLNELQDQDGVGISGFPSAAAPALNDQLAGDRRQRDAGNDAVEGAEFALGFG